jgi:hypothetical protein
MSGGDLGAIVVIMYRRNALQACAAVLAFPVAVPRAAWATDKIERVIGKVGKNHGHVFAVSVADVLAGVPKTYDIKGTSGHAHEVALGADDFKVLKDGGTVRALASRFEGRGHLHRVLVKAAPAVDPPEAIPVVEVVIAGQDDHELVINGPQMAARADVTYDIQGLAGHTHSVTVTSADFAKLATGVQVRVQSSLADDHYHSIFLRYPIKTG